MVMYSPIDMMMIRNQSSDAIGLIESLLDGLAISCATELGNNHKHTNAINGKMTSNDMNNKEEK